MWNYLYAFLFSREVGKSRYLRYVLLVLLAGAVVAGLIYASVFLNAVKERSWPPHVHTHGTH